MGRFKDGHLEFKVGVAVNKILDEDDFASDDNTAIATQQSIKAYIDSMSTGQNEHKHIQAYNNTTTDVNRVTPTAIIWSGIDNTSNDLFEIDSINTTRINVLAKCLCQVSFKINCLNSAAKVNMRSILRVNGSEILRSAVYSYDGIGHHASCTLPAYEYSFEKDDYIEIVAYRVGNSGTSNTIPGESFITLKLLRYE